jgi:hypothetical protein
MVTWSDRRGRGPIYSLITCNRGIYHYIHRLFVIEEYSFIFLGTEEYKGIYSPTLYSMVVLLVNRGI